MCNFLLLTIIIQFKKFSQYVLSFIKQLFSQKLSILKILNLTYFINQSFNFLKSAILFGLNFKNIKIAFYFFFFTKPIY